MLQKIFGYSVQTQNNPMAVTTFVFFQTCRHTWVKVCLTCQVASSPTLAPYLCGLGAAPGRGSFGVEADRRTGHPDFFFCQGNLQESREKVGKITGCLQMKC